MRSRHFLASLILLAGTLATTASAHKGATGVVKQRMDQMGSVAKSMKALGAFFKEAASYDPGTVAEISREIAEYGGDRLIAVFPEGSLKHPSEARSEVWSDWQRFVGLAEEMKTAANNLTKGAGNERDAASANSPDALFQALAATCKACHQDFRIKK